MNPYSHFVSEFERIAREARGYPMGGFAPEAQTKASADAPKALLFSPHPDDEAIVGGLALRLLRECGWKVVNIAVTLGSKVERRAARLEELKGACDFLGFELWPAGGSGFEQVTVAARTKDPNRWDLMAETLVRTLVEQQPRAIFFPHERDWNSAHIGTRFLVEDALVRTEGLECFLVETEYWGQMTSPNLMVEYTARDVADLVAAVSFHEGEVKRNPFHLRLPAWMHDNVRRGGELVGGQGQAAPDFVFGQLFRLRRWRNGSGEECCAGGRYLPATERPDGLFRDS